MQHMFFKYRLKHLLVYGRKIIHINYRMFYIVILLSFSGIYPRNTDSGVCSAFRSLPQSGPLPKCSQYRARNKKGLV